MRTVQRLASCIGETLEAIRVRSLCVDSVVREVYSTVYLRFAHRDDWLSIVICEGETRVERVAEPALRSLEAGAGRTQYPVAELTEGDVVFDAVGRELEAVHELVAVEDASSGFGVELRFGEVGIRLRAIDGESMDLNAGKSPLPEEVRARPLLHRVR